MSKKHVPYLRLVVSTPPEEVQRRRVLPCLGKSTIPQEEWIRTLDDIYPMIAKVRQETTIDLPHEYSDDEVFGMLQEAIQQIVTRKTVLLERGYQHTRMHNRCIRFANCMSCPSHDMTAYAEMARVATMIQQDIEEGAFFMSLSTLTLALASTDQSWCISDKRLLRAAIWHLNRDRNGFELPRILVIPNEQDRHNPRLVHAAGHVSTSEEVAVILRILFSR